MWFRSSRHLYIRPCYEQLFLEICEDLQKNLTQRPWVMITGTFGTGKSLFLLYFLWRFFNQTEDSGPRRLRKGSSNSFLLQTSNLYCLLFKQLGNSNKFTWKYLEYRQFYFLEDGFIKDQIPFFVDMDEPSHHFGY
jgi:predicted NACHT family NTPase